MLNIKQIANGIPNYGYLLFCIFSLTFFLIGLFLNFEEKTLNTLSVIFLYAALGFIIKNSLFFHKSIYYKILLMNIALILIGVALLISHITYSKIILTAFILSIILIFTIYIINKKRKTMLDYLKWFYVTSFILLKAINFNHYLFFNEIWVINFISTVLIVILIYIKHKPIFNWINQ